MLPVCPDCPCASEDTDNSLCMATERAFQALCATQSALVCSGLCANASTRATNRYTRSLSLFCVASCKAAKVPDSHILGHYRLSQTVSHLHAKKKKKQRFILDVMKIILKNTTYIVYLSSFQGISRIPDEISFN